MNTPTVSTLYLEDIKRLFAMQKSLAEKALAQIEPDDYHRLLGPEDNSIAIIMKHVAGNALSRWTDFLTTDGEKPDRQRDGEFIDQFTTKEEIHAYWERGWACVFATMNSLTEEDLTRTITIRAEPHSVVQAINRQISHYGYHVGQIVFLAKHFTSESWKTLSIPKKRA